MSQLPPRSQFVFANKIWDDKEKHIEWLSCSYSIGKWLKEKLLLGNPGTKLLTSWGSQRASWCRNLWAHLSSLLSLLSSVEQRFLWLKGKANSSLMLRTLPL